MGQQTEAALIYDSVYGFSIGLQNLEQSHMLKFSNVSCADEIPWDGGLSLTNYINAVSNVTSNKYYFPLLVNARRNAY